MNLRVGISLPTIEVRFEHLKIEAETYVGGRALPTVFNYCVNVVEVQINYYISIFGMSNLSANQLFSYYNLT